MKTPKFSRGMMFQYSGILDNHFIRILDVLNDDYDVICYDIEYMSEDGEWIEQAAAPVEEQEIEDNYSLLCSVKS